MPKDEFSEVADGQGLEVLEFPASEELIVQGITTPDTLDFLDRAVPPVLAPEPSPNDLSGWQTAIENANADHVRMRSEHRQSFEVTFEKAKEGFKVAHDFGLPGRRR